jgi:hypothetical protein
MVHCLEGDMEIWVKLTPGQGDEVWLVKLDDDGAFAERFFLKSLPQGENPIPPQRPLRTSGRCGGCRV